MVTWEANIARRNIMDSISSPRLPGKTKPGVSAKKIAAGAGSSINTTAKTQNWGRENIDDSSSVASIASSRTPGSKCYVCQEIETPSKLLIRCQGCRARFHKCCHNPPIFESSGFICGRCKKSDNDRPNSSTSMPARFTAPNKINTTELSKEYDSLKGGRPCSWLDCKTIVPFSQTPQGSDVFCKTHEIQRKFTRALAKPAAPKPPVVARPFRKKKLYTVRPDDRPLLKRKRNSVTKRASAHEKYEANPNDNSLEKSRRAIRNNLLSSPARPSKKTGQQNQKHVNTMDAPKPVGRGLEDDFNGSLGSASMITSSLTDTSPKFISNYLGPDSAHIISQFPATLPEYEIPPHPIFGNDVKIRSPAEHDDESPGSQIAQEFRATRLYVEIEGGPTQRIIDSISSKSPNLDDETIRHALIEAGGSMIEAEELLRLDSRAEPGKYQRFTVNSESNQFPDLPGLAACSDVSTRMVGRKNNAPAANICEPDLQRPIEESESVARSLQQQDHSKGSAKANRLPQPSVADTASKLHTARQQSKDLGTLLDTAQQQVNLGSSQRNNEMTGKECFAFANEVLSDDAATPGQPPLVSPETSSSTGAQDVLDKDTMQLHHDPLGEDAPAPEREQEQNEIQENELHLSSARSESTLLEVFRSRIAAEFDPSEIDSMLAMKSQPSTYQPTKEDILKSQNWAHVDPRIVWPRELPKTWLEEKCKEIQSRGGRKANYGKLITAQNRKERMENGWNIHQSRPSQPDTLERRERIAFMGEVIGVLDLENMEPKVVNGALCVVEKLVKDDGLLVDGRKNKKAPRCYPAV